MEAYVYDHARTPRGKGRPDGALHEVTSVELVTQLLKALRDRNDLDTGLLDDVIIGSAQPVGEQGGVLARAAVLQAGYAQTVGGQQIHRFCASGLDAVNLIAAQVMAGMIDAGVFAAMKPGAIFINGGRGATVQEDALLDALDHGSLRAAGLDVFATEPLPMDSPLRTHPKVTPLPHIGSATFETRHAMAVLATSNLLQGLACEKPAAVFGAPTI